MSTKRYGLPFGVILLLCASFLSLADCEERVVRRPAERHPIKGTVRTPSEGIKPHEINLNRMGARRNNSEKEPFKKSGEAKSEAKWQLGIGKDQKPVFVHEHTVYEGGIPQRTVQEVYEVDFGPGIGRIHVILMEHPAGGGHSLPHWEAGIPKTDAEGRLFLGSMGERAGVYEYHTANKIRIFYQEK